jgi:hypothetical protein
MSVTPGRTRYVVREGHACLPISATGIGALLPRPSRPRDLARKWLPEVEGYAAGMVDYLLRAKLQIVVAENKAEVTLTGALAPVDPGAVVHVYWEDEAGARTELATQAVRGDAPASFVVPTGSRKVAAYVRGQDGAGAFVAVAEVRVP